MEDRVKLPSTGFDQEVTTLLPIQHVKIVPDTLVHEAIDHRLGPLGG